MLNIVCTKNKNGQFGQSRSHADHAVHAAEAAAKQGGKGGVPITNHEPIFLQITSHVYFFDHFKNHVFGYLLLKKMSFNLLVNSCRILPFNSQEAKLISQARPKMHLIQNQSLA